MPLSTDEMKLVIAVVAVVISWLLILGLVLWRLRVARQALPDYDPTDERDVENR